MEQFIPVCVHSLSSLRLAPSLENVLCLCVIPLCVFPLSLCLIGESFWAFAFAEQAEVGKNTFIVGTVCVCLCLIFCCACLSHLWLRPRITGQQNPAQTHLSLLIVWSLFSPSVSVCSNPMSQTYLCFLVGQQAVCFLFVSVLALKWSNTKKGKKTLNQHLTEGLFALHYCGQMIVFEIISKNNFRAV